MKPQKRNEWLEADASDEEEEDGYESEEQELSKTARAVKRRRIEHSDDQSEGSNEEDNVISDDGSELGEEDEEEEISGNEGSEQQTISTKDSNPSKLSKSPNKLPKNDTNSTSPPKPKPKTKTGVIYLSRIPPFMKPSTVKRFLEPYGAITRIFLTPEDRAAHTARVRAGGNKKRSFTDGWVEFGRKKHAKQVAQLLNAQIIGGKKGGYYHDDLWNIKYLKGFKWHHLTEQIANENAERAARMRSEIAEARREDRRFVANVERAKMVEGIKRKRDERGTERSRREDEEERTFKQHEVKNKDSRRGAREKPSMEVTDVLSKIF